jgi:three-Cys-motif partner protein
MKGQGESEPVTIPKEEAFRAALLVSMRLSLGKSIRQYPLWIIDMCCGRGRNKVGCDGSPIEALKLVRSYQRRFVAFFCDREKDYITELSSRIVRMGYRPDGREMNGGRVFCWCRSNVGLLAKIDTYMSSKENPRYAVGVLLCDPNGCSPKYGFPLQEIIEFSAKWRRIDIILNVNVRAINRCVGLGKSDIWMSLPGETAGQTAIRREKTIQTVQQDWPVHSLEELLAAFPDRYWLIREPLKSSSDTFVIVVGREAVTAGDRGLKFWPATSTVGKSIVDWVDLKVKGKKQLWRMPCL